MSQQCGRYIFLFQRFCHRFNLTCKCFPFLVERKYFQVLDPPSKYIKIKKELVHTLTDGNESGEALELVRKALANKYPAAEKSFQNPSSSLEKNVRTASMSSFSRALFNPTKVSTPFVTRLLYRCFAFRETINKTIHQF